MAATEIRRRRKASGMTQSDAAERFTEHGYSVRLAAYSQIESGNTRITVDMLTVAAVVFNCSPTALLIPGDGKPDDALEYQGPGETTAAHAASWLCMETPFVEAGGEAPPLAEVIRWQSANFPAYVVPPAVRAAVDEQSRSTDSV